MGYIKLNYDTKGLWIEDITGVFTKYLVNEDGQPFRRFEPE